MMKKRLSWIAAVLALSVSSAWAQEPLTKAEETEAMLGMDHGQMDHGKMDHGSAPPPTAAAEGERAKPLAWTMGPCRAARPHPMPATPHAYSGGYTLDPARPLRLADEHNFGSLLADQFEVARARDNTSAAYELQAWYGRYL